MAITSVSGTLSHGSSVTIAGSSFGSKSTAAPVKYDDFEGGTLNADLSNGWHLDQPYSDQGPTYSNGQLRTNSTRSARCRWPIPRRSADDGVNFGLGITSAWPVNGGDISALYLDFWYYLDDTAAAPEYMRNHKLWRLHTGSTSVPNRYQNVYGNSGDNVIAQDGLGDGATGVTQLYFDGGVTYAQEYLSGQWSHFQVWMTESTVNTIDGVLWCAIDGIVGINGVLMTRTANTHWNQLYFGNYMSQDQPDTGNISATVSTYWDQVYIDTTPARIEIGNNATYASCTHREIWIPSAWSSTSVTATVNRGSFGASDSVYLFVVDSSNTPSAGFAITLGASSGGGTFSTGDGRLVVRKA